MKPNRYPIYRDTEALLLWLKPVVASLPKSLDNQAIGKRLINSVLDALEAIVFAGQQPDTPKLRLEYILLFEAKMANAKTAMRVLTEDRAVSLRKETQFLERLAAIGEATGRWHKKTASLAANVSNSIGQG